MTSKVEIGIIVILATVAIRQISLFIAAGGLTDDYPVSKSLCCFILSLFALMSIIIYEQYAVIQQQIVEIASVLQRLLNRN